MRVAVHFPAGHPLAPDGAVVAYKLGRIRDGIDNHIIHTGETVPLDEFVTGLVGQAQAEYPDAEIKVERLVDNGDETSSWVPAEEFEPAQAAPPGEAHAADFTAQANSEAGA